MIPSKLDPLGTWVSKHINNNKFHHVTGPSQIQLALQVHTKLHHMKIGTKLDALSTGSIGVSYSLYQ